MNPRVRRLSPHHRSARFLIVAALLGTLSCAPPDVPEEPENLPPVAGATLPQRWVVNRPVPVDTRYSYDPEGTITRVSVLFGDASPEVEAAGGGVEHAFLQTGTFDVRIEVEDDVAQVVRVIGTVVIVDELDEPACSCTAPCPDEAFCLPDGCFLLVTSEGAEAERFPGSRDPAVGGGMQPPSIPCEEATEATAGGEPNGGRGA